MVSILIFIVIFSRQPCKCEINNGVFTPSFLRNQPDFSQVTLNKLGITYIHDDSETTSDSFTFRAWVAPLDLSSSSSSSSLSALSSDSSSSSFSPLYSASSSSLTSVDAVSHHRVKDSLAVTETFNITVTPVNDQPPLIRSRTPSMKVVVGERVAIGPDNLQVVKSAGVAAVSAAQLGLKVFYFFSVSLATTFYMLCYRKCQCHTTLN